MSYYSYSFADIESVFSYLKENPNGDVKSWLEYRSKQLTENEREVYQDIKYADIPIKVNDEEYHLMLLQSNSDILDHFANKITGNKDYYEFYYTNGAGYFYKIISTDSELFNMENWKKFNKIGAVNLENKELGILLYYNGLIVSDDEFAVDGYFAYLNLNNITSGIMKLISL